VNILKPIAKIARSGLALVALILIFGYSLAGASWVSSLAHAQHIAPGETPLGRFYVVLVPDSGGDPFDSTDYRDIGKRKGMFLLPKDRDKVQWGPPRAGYETYEVLERSPASQLIEVHHHTGDYDFWSRYKASADTVIPVYSRMLSVGDGMIAFPFACFVTWLMWWLLRRFSGPQTQQRTGIAPDG